MRYLDAIDDLPARLEPYARRIRVITTAVECEDWALAWEVWSALEPWEKDLLYIRTRGPVRLDVNKQPRGGGAFTFEHKRQLRAMDRRVAETGSPLEQLQEDET